MKIRTSLTLVVLAGGVLAGCGGPKQPAFPGLSPVQGVVKRGGTLVSGGVLTFIAEPASSEFLINCEVKPDGTYSLTTVRTTDSTGERKPGVPPGSYKVNYQPPLGEQKPGAQTETFVLPTPVKVQNGNNDIPIDLPKK